MIRLTRRRRRVPVEDMTPDEAMKAAEEGRLTIRELKVLTALAEQAAFTANLSYEVGP